MSALTPIHTDDAPAPAGHYAQAIRHGDLVYVAGQLPIDPSDREGPPGDVEEQTERALRNVEAILRATGSGLDRLLSVTVYVTDMALWGRVNTAYARVLGDHRPARAVVPVPELHHGYSRSRRSRRPAELRPSPRDARSSDDGLPFEISGEARRVLGRESGQPSPRHGERLRAIFDRIAWT